MDDNSDLSKAGDEVMAGCGREPRALGGGIERGDIERCDIGPHGEIEPLFAPLPTSVAELREGLFHDLAVIGRAQHRQLLRIAALYKARIWEADHTLSLSPHYDSADTSRGAAHDMAAWVSQNLGMSRYKANRMVGCALAIDALEAVPAALCSGALTLDKAMELTRYVTPEDEAAEVRWACKRSLATVKSRADERSRLDGEQERAKRNDRSFSSWISDGMWFGNLMLAPDLGLQIDAAIEAVVPQLAPCPSDERPGCEEPTIEQLRADAMTEILLGGHAAGTEGDGATGTVVPGVVTGMVVHTTWGPDGFGNGVDGRYAVLHPDTVERISCDCRLRFVLTDEDGNALGIGRQSPVVPHWLRVAVLKAYDFRCTFPGCDCGTVDVHHLVHWTTGGPTDLENLAPMCRRHHALVHEHGWRAFASAPGTITWVRPDGKEYVPGPDPPKLFAA